MRNLFLSILFVAVILFGKSEIKAQAALPGDSSCNLSAKEILSIIKMIYNLSPSANNVLITGEIKATGEVAITDKQLSLSQVLAMVDGVTNTANETSIYIIRQSAGENIKTKLEIDFKAIKKGHKKDVMLEKGDVLFVPRNCIDGKLQTPTKSKKLINSKTPSGMDYPLTITNKRNTE